MIDDNVKQSKVDRFIRDETMSKAVFSVVLDTFLEEAKEDKKRDVNMMAASYLSIGLLQKAWKNMERYRSDASQDTGSVGVKQIGL